MEWSAIYENTAEPEYQRMIDTPDEWQTTLAEKLRSLVGRGAVLEAGCAYGLTSLLLGQQPARTLLDLEPKAIERAAALFAVAGQEATFTVGDIFSLPFPDDAFEVVFNAGVLEHFGFASRRAALLEMLRVTKPGGVICVAIPNHYSVPYRFAYTHLVARGRWQYPEEERIFDFSAELEGVASIVQTSRETVAPATSFFFLGRLRKGWFKFLRVFTRYEGYLTIITLKKGDRLQVPTRATLALDPKEA